MSMSLNFIIAWRTINDTIKRVLIWRFTLVLIKINYGQIGDQTGLFYTANPVFYTSGNRFVRRTGTFGNLTFSLVPSDNYFILTKAMVITRKGRSGCDRMVVLWIYNYMCNKCLSPLMLCVHGEVYSIQQYVEWNMTFFRWILNKWVQDLSHQEIILIHCKSQFFCQLEIQDGHHARSKF
jgi:hypothetical protein